ncbi:MAG: hypothetical protein WD275_09020, partial [Rhodothermales bacterium]
MSCVAAAGSFLAACRSENAAEVGAAVANLASGEEEAFSCTHVSKLTKEQLQTRKMLRYVDASPHAGTPTPPRGRATR